MALAGFALGHPMTLQMLGQSAWDIAASGTTSDGKLVIRAAHADEAISEVSEQLRTLYHKPAWRNCSAHERTVLKQLASMGGSAAERDLARAVTVKGDDLDPMAIIYDLVDGGTRLRDSAHWNRQHRHAGVQAVHNVCVTPGNALLHSAQDGIASHSARLLQLKRTRWSIDIRTIAGLSNMYLLHHS